MNQYTSVHGYSNTCDAVGGGEWQGEAWDSISVLLHEVKELPFYATQSPTVARALGLSGLGYVVYTNFTGWGRTPAYLSGYLQQLSVLPPRSAALDSWADVACLCSYTFQGSWADVGSLLMVEGEKNYLCPTEM